MTMYSREVYRQVAQLHAANIDLGFLSSLGTSFLALLYEAIDRSEGGVLLVALRQGQVVGFVAGTQGMRAIYGELLRRWPRLLMALLPAFASPTKLWKIGEIVLMGNKEPPLPNLPRAELLSIAVDPAQRRSGYAQSLYQGLVNHFRERNVERFRIVVGEPLTGAHRFYLKMGAESVGRIAVHRRQESVIYVHETTRETRHRSVERCLSPPASRVKGVLISYVARCRRHSAATAPPFRAPECGLAVTQRAILFGEFGCAPSFV